MDFHIGGDLRVHRMGFGAMHLTDTPTARAVLRRAVELGVTLVDTAHLYGWGANEDLIAATLHPYPDGLVVSTKIGVAPPGELCGRPEFLRAQVDEALTRLRLDRIDLLHLHRVDPAIPLADQVGTLADLRAAGKVRHLALSEVDVEQLAQAQALTPVAAVQNHYNLVSRDHDPVLDACTRAGTAFLPWRPVHPLVSTPDVAAVAADLDATPARVALAWLLARSPVVVPIPGTTSIAHLEENAAAVHLHLDDAHLDRLARI